MILFILCIHKLLVCVHVTILNCYSNVQVLLSKEIYKKSIAKDVGDKILFYIKSLLFHLNHEKSRYDEVLTKTDEVIK